MIKTWLSAVALAMLVGCATPYGPKNHLETGEYSKAYSMVIITKESAKDRQEIVSKILEATGGARNDLYFKDVQKEIRTENYKTARYFSETLRHINSGFSDKLLSEDQAKKLVVELRDYFEVAAMGDAALLNSNDLLDAFGLGRDRSGMALRSLERLKVTSDQDLKKYLAIYKVLKDAQDSAAMKVCVAEMQKVIAKNNLAELAKNKVDYSVAETYVRYVQITEDHQQDPAIHNLLSNINLTRKNVESFEAIFPDFAKSQLISRKINLDLRTNGDDFVLGEIADELKKINDWVELSPDGSRVINLVRLKLNEQRNPPNNATEIVPDPSFGTLLTIPKNASVLYDYSVSEYSMQWNFNAQDIKSKKAKNLSGSKKLKKVECRNVRYQNVFGGVGPIYGYPNDRVQNICNENSSVDFDAARVDVIKTLAREINEEFFIKK